MTRSFLFKKSSAKNIIRYNPLLRRIITMSMVNMGFPSILGIDPTNVCNLNCSFCGVRADGNKRGYMDFPLFKRIINESLLHGKRWMIILHNAGEPLLHKEICDFVEYAVKNKAARNVQFSTNGVLLTEELARGLIKAGLSQITFSVDAYSRQEYRELKGQDNLDKVVDNAKMLMRIKKELRSPVPFVSAKMVKRRGFEHTFAPFLRMWSPIVDEALLTPYSNWAGAVKYEGTEDVPSNRYACHFLWYYPVVNWDGKMFFCCATCKEGAEIGDLNYSTVSDIWRGEKLKRVREAHLYKRFAEIEPCAGCTYWSESKADLDKWLKIKQRVKGSR